ncbi:hypothetical protein ACFLXT_02800 [Chloroflexota bacterium]
MFKDEPLSEKERRILKVIFKAIATLLAIGFTIWIAWYEFGKELLLSKTFIAMMATWCALGFMFFLDQINEAIQKTTNEKLEDLTAKIDGLINEIRQDRNERNNNPSQ